MVVWVLFNRSYLPPNWFSGWMRNLIINIVMIVFISMIPGISAAGHLGGGVAGALVTVPLVLNRWGHGRERWLGLAGIIAAPVLAVGLILWSISDSERVQIVLLKAEKICRAAEKGVEPLLEKDGKEMFEDVDAVNKSLREFAVAEQFLKSTQARLQAISFRDPDLAKALDLGKEYVASWTSNLELLTTILSRRTPPTADEIKTLNGQYKKINNLTQRLKESRLFAP
jgi:hypothetical protein